MIPTLLIVFLVAVGVGLLRPGFTRQITEQDLFFPRRHPVPTNVPGCHLVEIPLQTEASLRGLHLPRDGSQTVLIYTYGNGETVADTWDRLLFLRNELDAHVVAVDYQGYGFSDGAPSIQSLLDDVIRVYDYCVNDLPLSPRRIVMYGRSIGTVPAIHLSAQRPLDGLILETPFTHVDDVIAAWSRNLPPPMRWFLRLRPSDALSSMTPQPRDLLSTYRDPLLVIHGDRDVTIPIALGRTMFELCPSPRKTWCELPGVGHADLSPAHQTVRRALARFMEDVRAPSSG